jgi:arabinofuranosyltransferase
VPPTVECLPADPPVSATIGGRILPRVVAASRVALLYLPTLVAAIMMFQRRWISEDAFIDLRVVRNLLAGHGPVYNIGERVEAFTNPLWVALLTGSGALGLPLEACAVYIGLTCSIVALVVAQHWSRRLHAAQRGEPRTFALPLGTLVVAALPPLWDFGTSGLETGLMFVWLAWSFALCVRVCERSGPDASRRSRRLTLTAFVAGLGPLIRPDLGVFTVAFALFIAFTIVSAEDARIRGLVRATTACVFVPLAYQVFRMGYYAALVPNTALAKEAGLLFWSQGWLYLRDAVDTYWLWFPFGMLLWVLTASVSRWRREGRAERAVLASAVASAALVHGTYIVAIGGDFMHVRMLLPSILALALPVGTVVVTRQQAIARRSPWILEAALVTAVWALLCAMYMRPASEGELGAFGITDERSFYVSQLNERNPVNATQYRRFIPIHSLAYTRADETRGRVLDIDGRVVPLTWRMPREIDAALTSVNIGAQGYLVGPRVHVIDRRGLADPIASRLRLDVRGRPGHEKELNDLWILARFAQAPPADASSAVKVLSCGGLQQVLAGIDEPLTVRRFVDNLRVAIAQRGLRIPADPEEARATFCGSGR